MGWYQLDINLKKARLSEPFNFVTEPVSKMSDKMEKWRISSLQWNPLNMAAHKRGVLTANIDLAPYRRKTRGLTGGEGPVRRPSGGRGRDRERSRG